MFTVIRRQWKIILVISLSTGASAQWLNYPTPAVPRTSDGKPNLSAPAPRTADGKPDLSGMWFESDARPDACPAGEAVCIRQEPLPIRAVNIGFSSAQQLAEARQRPGGLAAAGALPYQPWAAELVKQRLAAQATGAKGGNAESLIDQHARCMPPNFPRAWALPQNKKIVQLPGLVVILHEFNASYRQIYTDGRPLPKDPNPSWNGYSSGKWEGDTLVVQTIGFRDDLWLDMSGSPLTEAARVTERFRRPTFGKLELEVTVDDPKAYTKPWTIRMDQSIVLNTEMLDDICLENERDVSHYVAK